MSAKGIVILRAGEIQPAVYSAVSFVEEVEGERHLSHPDGWTPLLPGDETREVVLSTVPGSWPRFGIQWLIDAEGNLIEDTEKSDNWKIWKEEKKGNPRGGSA